MLLKLVVVFLLIWVFPEGKAIGDEEGVFVSKPIVTQFYPHPVLAPGSIITLMGLGDSLTQGTMDATNNFINTSNAYLQKVADSLVQVTPLIFTQPFFDVQENRLLPKLAPTNLGVDGADAFSVEGIEYYKRVGARRSFLNPDYLCDKLRPRNFKDKYDKVLYPINLLAGKSVSQIDSAIWALNQGALTAGLVKPLVVFWVGNNDSGTAALGSGGRNPTFLPIPLDQIEPEISPELNLLLHFGQSQGDLSFAPYTQAAIERNLTELQDFVNQYNRLLTRLKTESLSSATPAELLLLTLPYYSSVGYLFDSEDLEYYLQKLDPAYVVPSTFKRIAPPGEPITDPTQGDRISVLTFGLMYALLHSGYSAAYVNQVLEINGQQRDDLVLSEDEQRFIRSRVDDFNAAIKDAAVAHGPNVHLLDIGQYLNDALTGKTTIAVGSRILSRKWVRGSSLSLDGVHPGYTGQALIANFVLTRLNEILGLGAPLHDLASIWVRDPYVDQDGDGWAPGPNYQASGLTGLLFLFKDPNDGDPLAQPVLPPDTWDQISDALLAEFLNIPSLRMGAERLGIVPVK